MTEDHDRSYYILRDFAMQIPAYILEAYIPTMSLTEAQTAFADALTLMRDQEQ